MKRRRGSLRTAFAYLAAVVLSWPLESTIIVRDPGGLTAETAALILSGQQGGDLAIEAIAAPLAWASGSVTVGLFVEVNGCDLISGQQEEELRVEILVYAIAGEANVRGYVLQAFELDLGRYGEALAAGGFKFNGQLDLPPGDYSLAIMVRSPGEATQSLGLRRVALSVPTPDTQPVLLQPRFSVAEGLWINGFQVLAAAKEGGLSRARLQEAARWSAAKPLLPIGGRVEVLLPVFGLPGSFRDISFELLDGRGHVVGEAEFEVEGPAEAAAGWIVDRAVPAFLTGSFQLSGEPSGVPAGEYVIRAKARGPAGEPIYSPVLPVIVAAESDEPGSWATANRREQVPAPIGNPELPTRTRRTKVQAKDVELLKRRYAAILDLSTGDDRAGAASALRLFEQEAVAEFGERGIPSLVAAEMGLIKALGKESPDSLVPVARLHHQAYREHRSSRAFLLATHARNLALAIVELYIAGGTTEESARFMVLRHKESRGLVGSRLLASFGGDLQRGGLRRFSERLFRRALECDDTNEAALLGMGASFEKYSEYAEAVSYFERLVAAQPQSGEGRLRLGINQRRLGRKAKARKQLERVIKGNYLRWVQSLAYQELAQMDLEAGDLKRSADLLERGLERFPNEPKFYLQLAYLRNAAGEPWRAQAELDRLSRVREPDSEDSPRYTYSNWPADALDRAWDQTDEDVDSRLEALAAVLAAAAEGFAP
ncbi:MAG: hypothetical protein IH936_01305 [Acidobacteria bacterium]|nr:hypothetical protein [Acidobacteriota bacterium]